MYRQGQFKFIIDPIPFNFPVFDVWKLDANEKKKNHAVIDIWKLNAIVFLNSYLLPFQSKIIANI